MEPTQTSLLLILDNTNGQQWTDGYAVVGAGQTWGLNYWWSLDKAEGVYGLAAQHGKEAVGGTCHSGKVNNAMQT